MLDTLAAMISGTELAPGRAAHTFARAYGGEKIATVVGANFLTGPIEAALANGMLAHADETDDSHAPSLSHPGSAIVPAALAMGEQFGIGGVAFLRAVTLGYDIGPRVTMCLGIPALSRERHQSSHSIAGVFGAAAAAASAAGLDARQMRWLIDYTAQQSSGIAAWQRDTDHIEKAFVFAGIPARSGVTAALLVRAGWTGIDDVLSGPDNFLLAHGAEASAGKLTEQLGERYEVTRTNIKKWSVGSPIQAPLDALELLFKQRAFAADAVREVTVRLGTRSASVVDNRDIPDICLQHMVAVMLIDRTVSFKAAHDVARMQDPAVQRERAKVKLVPDEEPRPAPRGDRRGRARRRERLAPACRGRARHRRQSDAARRGPRQMPRSRRPGARRRQSGQPYRARARDRAHEAHGRAAAAATKRLAPSASRPVTHYEIVAGMLVEPDD